MPRYDAAVIGSGPAGLEAAINLKIRNKNLVLFGNPSLSGKLAAAPRIDNYLGFPGISGKELQQRFLEHIRQMEISILDEQVLTVYPMGDYFSIATKKGSYEASAVILATGTFSGNLLQGEQEFLGRGVGYCATCDAPLYRGKTVAILGYNEEAVIEADYVAEIAKKVYYIPMRPSDRSPIDGVEIIPRKAIGVSGAQRVHTLLLEGGELAVDGVFILRDSLAPTSLIPGIETAEGYIRVGPDMSTNLPGCFAAGDCTGKPHQYMRAAGQGQTAALSAVTYLAYQTKKD